MPSLLDILFGGQRQRALGWLLLHPDEPLHVRQLARHTSTHPGSLHRELVRLAEVGLILRTPRGNQVHYQANRHSPIFEELAAIFRKTQGMADVIRDALIPLEGIETAFIYGSVARGTAHANSDIDLLVVGEIDFTRLVTALHPYQETLGREINPNVYRISEFNDKLLANDPFIQEVVSQPKLFVYGTDHDFGQPRGDRETLANHSEQGLARARHPTLAIG